MSYTTHTLLRARFDARLASKVTTTIPKHDIRYYLNGLRVEAAGDRPGVYLVGCDGHRLLVAYDKDGEIEGDEGQGVIISMPREFISALRARGYIRGAKQEVVIYSRRVCVTQGGWKGMGKDGERYVLPGKPFIEGKYPDWRKVLPDFTKLKPGFADSLNGQYLAELAGLVGKTLRENEIKLWQEEPKKPVIVQLVSHPELVGVIMPMRADYTDDQLRQRMLSAIDTRRPDTPAPQSGIDLQQKS